VNRRRIAAYVLPFLIVWGIPGRSLGRVKLDPRLNEIAQALESNDLAPLGEKVSYSDWTKSVLQALSIQERRALAKAVRKCRTREIREGHVEQYRVAWRSRDLPDSEFIVSFLMNARPDDLAKPMIAFSSRVENIPRMLADALEKGQMPLVLSFYQPLSPWLEALPKLSPDERKNMVLFYRSLQLLENQKEDRVYKGPYVTPGGLLVQNELRFHLHLDGRWLAE